MGNKGLITNIQSYSLHDGPGSRITIFLKGCPLRCLWCSNPETQSTERELYHSDIRCMTCRMCAAGCKAGAITATAEGISIDRSRCVRCGTCVENCPTEAIRFSGDEMTPDEILERVERERPYVMNSGGGVTFSGGEPLLQVDFLEETAQKLKAAGYHLAIESSFAVPFENIERMLPHLDLLLIDLKAVTPALHRELTGSGNERILDNLRRAYGKKPLIFRIPVIPGLNATDEELQKMADFICSVDPHADVNLLPYHKLGKVKYENTGRAYALEALEAPGDEEMEHCRKIFTDRGLSAAIV